jgi:trimeric autotransporter adhesin
MRTALLFVLVSLFTAFPYAQDKLYYWSESDVTGIMSRFPTFQGDDVFNLRNRGIAQTLTGDGTSFDRVREKNYYGKPSFMKEVSGWSDAFTVPGIVDGYAYAMTTDGTNLYVGGNFSVVGGTVANNVIKWDGERWSSLGEGTENGITGTISSLAYIDGKLFVGGSISKAGSVAVNSIAYWDGAEWNALGDGDANGIRMFVVFDEGDTLIQAGDIWSLYAFDDIVYVGGLFHLAGTNLSEGVAGWNVSTGEWESFNGGISGSIDDRLAYGMSFAVNDGNLYVGGKFKNAGSVPARNIARWDGNEWNELGGGANNWVRGLDIDNAGNLYAVGFFDSVGTLSATGAAMWNGSSWESLGDVSFVEPGETYMPDLKEVCVMNGNVYVGGGIPYINDSPAYGLARWDGSQWHNIEGLQNTHELSRGNVRALQNIGNILYIGGDFTVAGDMLLNGLVMWNETSGWSALRDGSADRGIYDGLLYASASSANATYAGGTFSIAGGEYTKNIAKWTGNGWEDMSMGFINGIKGTVYTILVDGDDVYVGGSFGWAGSVEAYHIAKWNGTEWSSIGIGVGGISGASVEALYKIDNYLYVGGHFAIVGDDENYALPANSVARFNLTTNRWEALGYGLEYSDGFPAFVYAFEYDGTRLYAGGAFFLADQGQVYSIAVWNGEKWEPLGPESGENGVNGAVYVIKKIGDEIYFGGAFSLHDQTETRSLVSWNGENWNSVGRGVAGTYTSPRIYAIQHYNNSVIIGGLFDSVGGITVSNIALWNGTDWSDMEGGTNSIVTALSIMGDKLMVGGYFTIAGGKPSVSIAQYDLTLTSVGGPETSNPTTFHVSQNYPNPFNPSTTIRFILPKQSRVTIDIYNVLGQKITTLLDETRDAGQHNVIWTAYSPSGIYFYRIEAVPGSGSNEKLSHVGRMLLMR